ncbi:MAG: tRNA pseudouridine(38-40) synthase TruA [Planctomycetota bacterium]
MTQPGRNVKLTIEYDGTNYAGWQVQPNGTGVQEVVQDAIARITGETAVKLIGSGRTDAGVHAAGQAANFMTDSNIPAGDLVHAINSKLPDDVAIVGAEDVPADFHARYSAKSKTYRYSILNRAVRGPLERSRCHFVRKKLDVAAMREAAKSFVGEHDFAAFQSKPDGKSSVRRITKLDIEANGEKIDISVAANGFLYNMVRAIAGTLIEVGLGARPPGSITELIGSRDRAAAGPTAPAHGLCLMKVEY